MGLPSRFKVLQEERKEGRRKEKEREKQEFEDDSRNKESRSDGGSRHLLDFTLFIFDYGGNSSSAISGDIAIIQRESQQTLTTNQALNSEKDDREREPK